jgi:Brp/Blh family beta-carotene 15,15'-monooxygenase
MISQVGSRLAHWRASRDPQFLLVVAVTLLVAVSTRSLSSGSPSVIIAVAVVATLGIPHGAVDHVVAMSRLTGTISARRVDAWYVAAIAAYAVVWALAPAIALVAFLVMSVHHFGQSDLAVLRLSPMLQIPLQWSRGLFLIGLPLVVHASAASPVIAQLGGPNIASWQFLESQRAWLSFSLVAQHVLMLFVVAGRIGWQRLRRQLIGIGTLSALFVLAEPLIGFAIYFGLWHSLQHIKALQRLLGREGSPLSTGDFARIAAPRTAISLAGLALLVAGAVATGRYDAVLPIVIVVLSVLTLPHMVIVERLWRSQG